MTATWTDFLAQCDGVHHTRHAVLTVGGTWEPAPGTQYPSNVVNGLAEYIDDSLCFEVPVPYPASFGPIGGQPNAPSYIQSVDQAVTWITNWLAANPTQTFALGGYSQGGEVVSRIAIELMDGALQQHLPQFIGGYTFGNPCRIADHESRGISSTLMTQLPTIDGQTVWVDYFHSPTRGDPGTDMYASVPLGQVGKLMTDVYAIATSIQINDLDMLTRNIVNTLVIAAHDLGVVPAVTGGLPGLFDLGASAIEGIFTGITRGPQPDATGAAAATQAALAGLNFLTAPGGPTAPHISYLGEIGGYSNLVADAVGHLHNIATGTPARV